MPLRAEYSKIQTAKINQIKKHNKSEQATPRKPSDQFEIDPGAPVL